MISDPRTSMDVHCKACNLPQTDIYVECRAMHVKCFIARTLNPAIGRHAFLHWLTKHRKLLAGDSLYVCMSTTNVIKGDAQSVDHVPNRGHG